MGTDWRGYLKNWWSWKKKILYIFPFELFLSLSWFTGKTKANVHHNTDGSLALWIQGYGYGGIWRANCIVSFYIRDLSICVFWYLQGTPSQSPQHPWHCKMTVPSSLLVKLISKWSGHQHQLAAAKVLQSCLHQLGAGLKQWGRDKFGDWIDPYMLPYIK